MEKEGHTLILLIFMTIAVIVVIVMLVLFLKSLSAPADSSQISSPVSLVCSLL
ncbi:MAG: hypothetical protein WCS91_05125 [Bacilli bacterium]